MSIKAADVRKHLFSLTARGIKFDLKRIIEASNRIGVPHSAYKCIHVAGTNGKGSTCAYIESILRTSGFKTGLFTSPHILIFEERFQIDGKIISEDSGLVPTKNCPGL
jgi:dihydrofolate synthase/folylpolyglutamate synthase